MKQGIKVLIFVFVIQTNYNMAFAQFEELDTPAEPIKENKLLIDSLVKVSKFDLYFIDYASSRIELMSYEKGWTEEEVTERKSRIDINKFIEYTVYNSFSMLTTEELKELITIMGKLNREEEYSFYVFSTSGIENNMDIYVRSKYLK